MGILRDALNLGLITLDQYEQLEEQWSEWGYDSRHYGDVEAFQKMMENFLDLGFEDLAESVFEELNEAISYYEDLYDNKITYDMSIKHWRDVETGRFVKDPYEWIRD